MIQTLQKGCSMFESITNSNITSLIGGQARIYQKVLFRARVATHSVIMAVNHHRGNFIVTISYSMRLIQRWTLPKAPLNSRL